MEHQIIALKNVIRQELAVYKDILTKAKEKNEALLKNDVPLLDNIVACEWNLLKTIKQLETQREEMIAKIAATSNVPQKELRLENITDMLEGGLRNELSGLMTELMQVISELTALNTVNKGLVKTHLGLAPNFRSSFNVSKYVFDTLIFKCLATHKAFGSKL